MIDTIKIAISLNYKPEVFNKFNNFRENEKGFSYATLNPTNLHKKQNIYAPKFTLIKRPNKNGRFIYEVLMEFSAPKLIFGENFSELSNEDKPILAQKISNELQKIGVIIPAKKALLLPVRKIDFSKNIPTEQAKTFPTSIISKVARADISKHKDIQKTNFRNGGIAYHIHTNTKDIVLYDKLEDLRQARRSEKRSIEKNNYTQFKILKDFENVPPTLRFEVRLNGKSLKKIQDKPLTLNDVFSSELSRKILLENWREITKKLPVFETNSKSPKLIFEKIISDKNIKAKESLSLLGIRLLEADTGDLRHLRNIFENRFGKDNWRRFFPQKREKINISNEKSSLLFIEESISEMNPTKLSDYIK